MKPKTRQNLLLAIMAVVCLLVARRYLPAVKLPTAGRVAAQERLLQSLQGDLKVARKVQEDRQASLKALHTLADPFWIPSGPAAKVDQEITAEFNRLARLAQLSSATGSQKVDVNKEKNGSCLQEVILSVRPEEFLLDPDASAEGIGATVDDCVFLGLNTHYFVHLESGEEVEIIQESSIDSTIQPGTKIKLTMNTDKVNIFTADGSANILTGVCNDCV